LKLFVRVFLLFFINLLSAEAQSVNAQLEVADSLFENRQYTQAFELYDEVYRSGKATPAMLLKMAYSEEAQENLGNALFYLHDYYHLTADERAVEKMQELAQVNALNGYERSEYQKFQKLVADNRYLIFLVLMVFAAIILIMMFRKMNKHQEKSLGLITSLVLIVAVAMYTLNFTSESQKGLIMENDAYIMSGPSAASELIEMTGQGHKVEILDQQDIWVKINWNGRPAYIRESSVRELR